MMPSSRSALTAWKDSAGKRACAVHRRGVPGRHRGDIAGAGRQLTHGGGTGSCTCFSDLLHFHYETP